MRVLRWADAWKLVWIAAGALFIVDGILLYQPATKPTSAERPARSVAVVSAEAIELDEGARSLPSADPARRSQVRPALDRSEVPAPLATATPTAPAQAASPVALVPSSPAPRQPDPGDAPLAAAPDVSPTALSTATPTGIEEIPATTTTTPVPETPAAAPTPPAPVWVLSVDFYGRVQEVTGSLLTVSVPGEELEDAAGCSTVSVATNEAELRGTPVIGVIVRIRGELEPGCRVNASRVRVED